MGMGGGSKPGSIKNDINVTPLVDVVLVLLIIFMVITPMLQNGKDVRLPKASKQKEDPKKGKGPDPLILSVTPDKEIYVEQDKYDETNLETRLAEEFGKDPRRKILLKGDESLTFADVRKVMQISKKAGAKGIALGIEELKE